MPRASPTVLPTVLQEIWLKVKISVPFSNQAPKPPHSHEKTEDQSFPFGFVDPRHSETWEGDDILQLGRD